MKGKLSHLGIVVSIYDNFDIVRSGKIDDGHLMNITGDMKTGGIICLM